MVGVSNNNVLLLESFLLHRMSYIQPPAGSTLLFIKIELATPLQELGGGVSILMNRWVEWPGNFSIKNIKTLIKSCMKTKQARLMSVLNMIFFHRGRDF